MVQSIDGVKKEFDQDEAKHLVGSAEEVPNEVKVWAVLLVHQKVAALFMPGVNAHNVVELYQKIQAAVSTKCHQYLDGLYEFMHVAATAKENADGSVLEKKWMWYDNHQNDRVLVWYEQLLDVMANTSVHHPCQCYQFCCPQGGVSWVNLLLPMHWVREHSLPPHLML